jgi:hypothetical protein
MSRMLSSLTLFLSLPLFLACGLGGTFDNTGGSPPSGDPLSFEELSLQLDVFCLDSLEGPLLVREDADVPLLEGFEGCRLDLLEDLRGSIDSLAADEALVLGTLQLGGCTRSFELMDVFLDDTTVRPWVLYHDTTLGSAEPVACTLDLLIEPLLLKVGGVADATDVELHEGSINPNRPRVPDAPVLGGFGEPGTTELQAQ